MEFPRGLPSNPMGWGARLLKVYGGLVAVRLSVLLQDTKDLRAAARKTPFNYVDILYCTVKANLIIR